MLTIRRHHLAHGLGALLGALASVSAGQYNTRCQPFQIPFPRGRKGLVEIVDIENQPAFRRAESPKIQYVAIAASLHADAGRGRSRQIERHQSCRAAKKSKWRTPHPRISNW